LRVVALANEFASSVYRLGVCGGLKPAQAFRPSEFHTAAASAASHSAFASALRGRRVPRGVAAPCKGVSGRLGGKEIERRKEERLRGGEMEPRAAERVLEALTAELVDGRGVSLVNRRDELTPPQSIISMVYRADRHSDPAPNDSSEPRSES
jgi:hypothetical protein